jgi:hypothetical protein
MKLLILFLIGMLIINIGINGGVGNYLCAIIAPDYMREI